MWGLVNGKEKESRWLGKVRKCDVYTIKNLLEELSVQQGLELSLTSEPNNYPLSSFLHPYRQAVIVHKGKHVGIIGEIHPQILVNHKIKKQRPCYFEIDEQVLYQGDAKQDYVVPPVHMNLERTITFALPLHIESFRVASILESHQTKVQVVDRFDFTENDTPLRAITYKLAFANEDGSRSADSVNQILQTCIETVLSKLGEHGVAHR